MFCLVLIWNHAAMDKAYSEEVRGLLNDASHAINGSRSEQISTNYLHAEELRQHEILHSLVNKDLDGYGEDDCNVMLIMKARQSIRAMMEAGMRIRKNSMKT